MADLQVGGLNTVTEHRHSCDAYDAGGPCDCQPYLFETVIVPKYNPDYPQYAECSCGHSYYRHFDTYPDYDGVVNKPIGCKYCFCDTFKEKP